MVQTCSKTTQQIGQLRHYQTAIRTAALHAILAMGVAAHSFASRYIKTPMHISALSGQAWMDKLLTKEHRTSFYNAFGMHQHVFHRLVKQLWTLAQAGATKYVSIEEQLGIFLYIAVTGNSNQKAQERF